MSKWIDSFVKSTTVLDIGILKALLFVTGLIFGAYYSEAVLNNINFWYGAFFVFLVLLLYRVYKK
ncbi:MAG: hypothetical protein V3R52_08470 [Candidatus Neomarinimicrobiota bacterium]